MKKKTQLSNSSLGMGHCKIPHQDLDWAFNQSPTVLRLFLECWRADYGGTSPDKNKLAFHALVTKFQGDNFRKAKKIVESEGLFLFEKRVRHYKDGTKEESWHVSNLHGAYTQWWKDRFEIKRKRSKVLIRKKQNSIRTGIARKNYKKFLESTYWKAVRKLILARDHYTCVECGSRRRLQVHHITYIHHRDELNHLEDLETLCRDCHYKKHS
jgi:5-methylcytosine-specific restriction endonuclease McrA